MALKIAGIEPVEFGDKQCKPRLDADKRLRLSQININDKSDDIIRDAVLYDYICRILDTLMHRDICSMSSIKDVINEQITDYEEAMPGARERLANALEIIVIAYYAALIKRHSDEMLTDLMSNYGSYN